MVVVVVVFVVAVYPKEDETEVHSDLNTDTRLKITCWTGMVIRDNKVCRYTTPDFLLSCDWCQFVLAFRLSTIQYCGDGLMGG